MSIIYRKLIFFGIFLIAGIFVWVFGVKKDQNVVQSFLNVIPFVQNEQSDTDTASLVEFSGERYVNSQFGFSFEKPRDFNIGEFPEGDNYVVLAQQAQKNAFQIFITPNMAQEDIALTRDVLVKNIPGIQIENEKEIKIGEANGLFFQSENPAFGGESTEAWFIYKGNLYQLSGYIEAMPIVEEVIKTWKFE